MIDDPPEWLEDWGGRSEPSSRTACARARAIAFARENGSVYHTW